MASDTLSGVASASCADRLFPATDLHAGSNIITFSATDRAGNIASQAVVVSLQVTPTTIGGLISSYLGATPGASGVTNSLVAQLSHSNILGFIAEVEAQCCNPPNANKRLNRAQADALIELAQTL